jgi:hypothetical protein
MGTSIINKSLFAIVISFLICVSHAHTHESGMEIPLDIKAKLFLTALTYDKALTNKVTKQFAIGILFSPNIEESEKEAKEFYKALMRYIDKKISGLSFKPVLLPYRDSLDLNEKLDKECIKVLYLSYGDKNNIMHITKIAKSKEVFTITDQADYLSECGASMRIDIKSKKPKIILNLNSARSEGANFSSKFLRVVELVE